MKTTPSRLHKLSFAALAKALILWILLGGVIPELHSVEPPAGETELGIDTETAAPAHLCVSDYFYGKSRLNALTFKVNAVAAAVAVTNAAFELEWRRWSVQLPLYYSNLDYFSHRVKFRTGVIQPGVRYWFAPDRVVGHTGFFAGAHFGIAWYNMSFGGTDRIQDRDGRTPAIGGGLEGGWRRTLGRSGHWKLELSLGVGVYSARYDLIDNTTGVLRHTSSKVFVGVDHVGVTFGYSLDLKKKGGVVTW